MTPRTLVENVRATTSPQPAPACRQNLLGAGRCPARQRRSGPACRINAGIGGARTQPQQVFQVLVGLLPWRAPIGCICLPSLCPAEPGQASFRHHNPQGIEHGAVFQGAALSPLTSSPAAKALRMRRMILPLAGWGRASLSGFLIGAANRADFGAHVLGGQSAGSASSPLRPVCRSRRRRWPFPC